MDDQVFQLTPEQIHDVSRVMTEIQGLPLYPYPWNRLKRKLTNKQIDHLPLVAYGSLVNSESAERTLSQSTLLRSKPVVAFGVRRTFDYIMPENTLRYGKPIDPRARAALNVHVTGKIDDRVNGILIDLFLKDISALQRREVDYALVPVACMDWTNRINPFPAYILQSERRVDTHLQPHQAYYEICRDGAAQFGQEFLSLWLNTTFLGDGKTPVKEWETKELSSE